MEDEQLGDIVQVITYEHQNSGKRLRPALATMISETLNGDFDETIAISSACELLHSASLMLDDTIDNDNTRRGKPSVHTMYGGGLALMGTYVLALMGLKIGINRGSEIGQLLVDTLEKLVVGGSQELYWDSWEVTDYDNIISNKTAALFSASCLIGAMCAKEKKFYDASSKYGQTIGMLYQHCDDYVDIAKSIKLEEPIGDIKNQTTTTAILHCYEKTQKAEIRMLLRLYREKKVHLPDYSLRLILSEIDELHSLDYEMNIIKNLAVKATQIASTFPNNKYQKYLEAMPQFMVDVQMEEIDMPILDD